MKRLVLPLLVLSWIASDASAQTTTPQQLGIGGQGMGGSAAFANPLGQMGAMGYGGLNGSGFVPGGQNMGGRALSMNQYMTMLMLRSMAGRNGSYGPRSGVANPFVTPNYPGAGNPSGQQMSLQPPKTKSSVTRMTPEERKANVRRLAEARKAKAKEAKDAAAAKKAKAAQKNAPAKQG